MPTVRRTMSSRLSAGGVRLSQSVAEQPVLWGIVALAALFFLYRYGIDEGRPGEISPRGWYGAGADEQYYLIEARNLLHLTPHTQSQYAYGFGYPAVAVPFLWIGFTYDPFVIPDGLAYVFVIASTYVIARRVFNPLAGLFAAFGLMFASTLTEYTTAPWNSTVCMFAAAVILLLATSPRPRQWHFWVIGAMIGWGYSTRFIDFIWLAALALPALLRLNGRGQRMRAATAVCIAAFLLALPTLIANDVGFGSPFTTPYAARKVPGGSEQSLAAFDLTKVPRRAFGMFISPYLLGEHQPGAPFLADAFWMLLAIPGAVLALWRGARHRQLMLSLVITSLVASVFYLSFHATGADRIQDGALHYFKMWWPGWAILAGGAIAWVARKAGGLGAQA